MFWSLAVKFWGESSEQLSKFKFKLLIILKKNWIKNIKTLIIIYGFKNGIATFYHEIVLPLLPGMIVEYNATILIF